MANFFQVDTGQTLTTSLVSYFKLEDLTDAFGANTLTNNATVTFIAGKVNNAASFNGSTQYLSRANVLSAATTNVTMACWVHITSISQHGGLLHNGKTDGSDGYTLGVGTTADISTNGNKLILLLDGVGYTITSTANIGTGWHLVGVSRGASTWKVWIDAVADVTTSTTGPNTPTGNFLIGRDYTTSTDRSFNDLIDEVGFWTKELSQQEWTDLYNSGNGQTMIANWSTSVSDTLGGITDSVNSYLAFPISVSDILAGVTDSAKSKYGFSNQVKSPSTWTNQIKS